MSLFKKFGQQPDSQLDAFVQHLQQQREQQMAQALPWGHNVPKTKQLDVYERAQLALQQLQILFLAGELEKHELLNATRMTLSLDRENLTVVEEIIKVKLG